MQAIDQVSDNNKHISVQDVNVYQEKLEQLKSKMLIIVPVVYSHTKK